MKRTYRSLQIEAMQHFPHLLLWCRRPHPIAVGDSPGLQQTTITRQNNAPLSERTGNDIGILVIVPVQRIETEHAQVFGQFPEMDVENKCRLTQRLRSETEEGRDVKTFEDRI